MHFLLQTEESNLSIWMDVLVVELQRGTFSLRGLESLLVLFIHCLLQGLGTSKYSLESWTWQQEQPSGQRNVPIFFPANAKDLGTLPILQELGEVQASCVLTSSPVRESFTPDDSNIVVTVKFKPKPIPPQIVQASGTKRYRKTPENQHFCHTPAKLRLKPSWVGCIIGFDNPKTLNPKTLNPVPTSFNHFQINQEADFRYATLVQPNQMISAKKKVDPNFFGPKFVLPKFFF